MVIDLETNTSITKMKDKTPMVLVKEENEEREYSLNSVKGKKIMNERMKILMKKGVISSQQFICIKVRLQRCSIRC